ncbi:57ef8ea7-b8c8-4c50-9bd9-81113f3f826a [Sclerotinia trifoliorum]|uniref:57ef8ea7-b8c8-4c50-9bd9-81113f3f826a n=1 Tax=Sclerotinia trifoliorum TaxID=28548 RepID=A0A8H2VL71_9HELO|nr:57ef8ea7-b8c8-4c50-9bd9-81113f3f826a [Sclerotinia trifoliorum]
MATSSDSAAAEVADCIHVDGTEHKAVDIGSGGNVILEVLFENTKACTKSIPNDMIQKLRTSKTPFPSARVFYRIRLDTLKKHSKYFGHLLGSDAFEEGRAISAKFAELSLSRKDASKLPAEELPRIQIKDEDYATRTIGRETVFHDMLRIIHGMDHSSKSITLLYIVILVVMADRYDCMATIARYITGRFSNFRYPPTLEKTTEEVVRQKIIIFYHTNQALRLSTATKELIIRGSSRWSIYEEADSNFAAAWWDLPEDLEAELSYRRSRIILTISSLQTNLLSLYTSRKQQCKLGYDSSAACDSFQLGEMVKFLTKKNLLSLIPFQAVSPDDPEFLWPKAYDGDAEQLITLLRQCPSYQIDKNHGHCGLRSKLLPALDYIKECMDAGIGIKVQLWKTERSTQTWIPSPSANNGNAKKAFVVGGMAVGEEREGKFFDFKSLSRDDLTLGARSLGVEKAAKKLFLAEKWDWVREVETEKEKEMMSKSSFFRF